MTVVPTRENHRLIPRVQNGWLRHLEHASAYAILGILADEEIYQRHGTAGSEIRQR